MGCRKGEGFCREMDGELSCGPMGFRCHRHGDYPKGEPLKAGSQESDALLAVPTPRAACASRVPQPLVPSTRWWPGFWKGGLCSFAVLRAHSRLPPTPTPRFLTCSRGRGTCSRCRL